MSYIANLETARDNIAAILAEITATPKPSYSIDGESYSWNEYQAMLMDRLDKLTETIERASGGFEEETFIA